MPTPAVLQISGVTAYESAWSLQQHLVHERAADRRLDTLLLLEHAPVFTVGRRGNPAHWPAGTGGVPMLCVERGGSVTYHGPGQLVGYPIVRLARFAAGPKAFVQRLEEVLLRTLREFQLTGHRLPGRPGIWIGRRELRKIASLGLRIQQGVTMHGFALNVTVDLSPFGRIVPCGLPGCRMTSMEESLNGPVAFERVRAAAARHFAEVFDVMWTPETLYGMPETAVDRSVHA